MSKTESGWLLPISIWVPCDTSDLEHVKGVVQQIGDIEYMLLGHPVLEGCKLTMKPAKWLARKSVPVPQASRHADGAAPEPAAGAVPTQPAAGEKLPLDISMDERLAMPEFLDRRTKSDAPQPRGPRHIAGHVVGEGSMSEPWCSHCHNTGTLDCFCGGDLCVCERNGEYPCPHCDGVTAEDIDYEDEGGHERTDL